MKYSVQLETITGSIQTEVDNSEENLHGIWVVLGQNDRFGHIGREIGTFAIAKTHHEVEDGRHSTERERVNSELALFVAHNENPVSFRH